MPNRVSLARLFFAVSLIWSSSAQGVSASPQNNASAPTYSPIIGASYGPWQAPNANLADQGQPVGQVAQAIDISINPTENIGD